MSNTVKAFILRIAEPEYEELIYSRCCYYTSLKRRFSKGDLSFFLMKKEVDSFVGYSKVASVKELSDIEDPDEKEFCINNGWCRKIEFSEAYRFKTPLPLRLVFPGLHKLGRALHGLELNLIEVKRIFDLEDIVLKYPEILRRYCRTSRPFNEL
ncbi:MAG: hypothetical protein ABDH32_03995 [Candidatus Caldarchaeales archaeon]